MSPEGQTIPEDILRDAKNALQVAKNRRHPVASIVSDELIVEAIAEALVIVRERCASLLDGYEITLLEYPSDQAAEYYQAGAIDAFVAAAAAIRNGGA